MNMTIDSELTAAVLRRIADEQSSDPASDDLTVPLAIECAEKDAEITRLKRLLVGQERTESNDYFQGPQRTVIQHEVSQAWIAWNWRTASWDRKPSALDPHGQAETKDGR